MALYFFETDILYHEDPITNDQELLLNKNNNFDFNQNNFNLMIGVVDFKGVFFPIDPTFFTLSVYQNRINLAKSSLVFKN